MSELLEELEGDVDSVDDLKEWSTLLGSDISEQEKSFSSLKHDDGAKAKEDNKKNDAGNNLAAPEKDSSMGVLAVKENKPLEQTINPDPLKTSAPNEVNLNRKHKLPAQDQSKMKVRKIDNESDIISALENYKDKISASQPEVKKGKDIPKQKSAEVVPKDGNQEKKIPDAALKSSVPETSAEKKLPDATIKSSAVETNAEKKLPDVAIKSSAVETNAEKKLPDAAIKSSAVETNAEKKLPDAAIKSSAVETNAEKKLPDAAIKSSAVETNAEKKTSDSAKVLRLSEAESRNIDIALVEEMMREVRKKAKLGDKYIVRFSPVELADFGDLSVQELIQSQPNLSFYFKRQGKFKKKKGYAECYLNQSPEVQTFIQKLLQVKLLEKKVEVTITNSHGDKEPEILSFTALLERNNQLVKLLKTTDDSSKSKVETKEYIEVEKVPSFATTLMLKNLFPFSKTITLPARAGKNDKTFQGPTQVFYPNEQWIEAILNCCTDFKYNSNVLKVTYQNKVATEIKLKLESEVKKEVVVDAKKENIPSDLNDNDNSSMSGDDDKNIFSTLSGNNNPTVDADISSMTLDVCTGMLESLNKLKKLGTDNPNVLKILEMQAQLASLQQSLAQSVKVKSTDSLADPWTVGPSDSQEDINSTSQGLEKLSKKDRKKVEAMKRKKEMEDLERMLEEADEAERQREKNVLLQREAELQKAKLAEEKPKLSWARKMIEEAKQTGGSPAGDSTATKEEAQRMLRAREERLKEEEEAKKMAEKKNENEPESMQIEAESTGSTIEQDPLPVTSDTVSPKVEVLTTDKAEPQADSEQESQGSTSTVSSQREEVIIYSEAEYNQMVSNNTLQLLPALYSIQLSYYNNRMCPVSGCPAAKFFKTAGAFNDHWEIFHKPNVTMRFCSRCSAYFMNVGELESHLNKRHSITNPVEVEKLVKESRVKVVSNPSYRDPGPFLGPVV